MTANPCEKCKAICGAPDSSCPYFNEPDHEPTGKTYNLRYGRVANLGNYESCRVELEEPFDASIRKDVAFETLADHVEQLIATRRKVRLPIRPPMQTVTR